MHTGDAKIPMDAGSGKKYLGSADGTDKINSLGGFKHLGIGVVPSAGKQHIYTRIAPQLHKNIDIVA